MSKIRDAVGLVPSDSGAYEDENGVWVNWDGIDFKIFMAISISEFGLPAKEGKKLRSMGAKNLGHLICHNRTTLKRWLTRSGFMIIEVGLKEIGLTHEMNVCPSRLSDYELVNVNDSLMRRD